MAAPVKTLPKDFVLDEPEQLTKLPEGFVIDVPGRPEPTQAADQDFLEKFLLSDKPIEEWLPSEQADLARSLLDDFENPAEQRAKISNAILLSELFGVPFDTVIATQPEMMGRIYGKELKTLSDSVVNKKLKEDAVQALKEIPENIWIGTVGMAASVLESMKRRSIQLAGGGILPDEALRHQFEAITPGLEPALGGFRFKPDRLDFIRPQQPLPGAIGAEAFGILTRLPDIGAKIIRSKQRALQDEQDIAEISNAPITKLARLVFQSGVPSIAVAAGVSILTGNLLIGLVILGETEGGAAFEQQLQLGGSIRKSLIIAELSEAAEIGGEMLVFPKIVRGLTEGISLRKALTLIVENATQEGVTGFNQRFLEVYGAETTKGTDKATAAKMAFVEAYRAIPENAFVGGATAGLAGGPSAIVGGLKGRRASKAQARRMVNNIAAEVDKQLTEPVPEAAAAAVAAKVAPTRPVTPEPAQPVPAAEVAEGKVIPKELEPLAEEVPRTEGEVKIKGTPKEKRLVEDFAEGLTTQEWREEYQKEKLPHWMTDMEPSPLSKELSDDLKKVGIEQADILEIGSGNGRDSIFLAKQGHRAIGIDIAEQAVAAANKNAGTKDNVTFEKGDVKKLKFQDNSFDAVFSVAALHSTVLDDSLAEIHRVLKPGGIAKIHQYTKIETAGKTIHYWKPEQIKKIAKEAGFSVLESHTTTKTDFVKVEGVRERIKQDNDIIVYTIKKEGIVPAAEVAEGKVELQPREGETKDAFRARVRAAKGIEIKPPISAPTKAEKAVIDAKKFNADIKAHEAQVKGEEGRIEIETEEVDDVTEPLGRTMTPEWYEASSKTYKTTILKKGTDLARRAIEGLDFLVGVTSTRLRNISPELGRKLRRHEFNVMTRTTEQVKRVEPFLRATTKRKLGKDFAAFDIAFKNSEGKIVSEFAEKHGFTKELREIRRVLDELFNQGNAVGLEIDYLKSYFPRVVKDTKGFLEFFQKGDDWSIIRTVIENKESARGRVLTESERAAAVNTLLRGYRTSALTLTAPGAAKARTVQEVTPEINQFYQGFSNSLTNYIEIMNEKIAAREFFGRQSKEITKLRAQQSTLRTRLAKLATRQGRQKPADADKEIRLGFFTGTITEHISRAKDQFEEVTERLDRVGADDLSNTIGQYVLELVVNEEIQPSQEKEIRDLLMGRFDPKSAHGLIGEIIPLTYIDVLSQITNSLTQLEELALAFYRSPVGFIPAATKAALNLSEITLEDIGVTIVAQELTDADSRKILSTLLSITQFKRFDAFAKQTFINTALKQLQNQSRKEGMTFNDRLERVFGEETDQVVKDLKAGRQTEDVKFLMASQLMDIQPIAKSEMPEAYNRAGNMRIFYQLKTFMIKQFDFVRTEALQDMRNPAGDPTRFMRGFGRLMWLSFSLALFGAGRDLLVDFVTGRPFDLSDSVVDTFLRRVFFSRFQYSKAMREGIGTAFLEGLIPPTKTIDAITKDIKKVSKNDEKGLEVWRSVPIVGELYYWWFGRGREKAEKERRRARRESVRRKPLFTGTKVQK